MPGMTAEALAMTGEQRARLEEMSRSHNLPHRKVVQAKALLLAADGVATNEVARCCGTTDTSVRAWRRRFEAEGVAGVGRIAGGRGRRSWLPAGTVAEVVRVTQKEVPDDGSTHWTTRRLAERFGIGKDTVARIWRDHELKHWKVDRFKISNASTGPTTSTGPSSPKPPRPTSADATTTTTTRPSEDSKIAARRPNPPLPADQRVPTH
jgi:transposase